MRRVTICAVIGSCVLLVAPGLSHPADYPSQPVRVVVGFSAGGASDVLARLYSEKLSIRLGQPVIVENRPGAAGTIATAYVANARPDGHTLLHAFVSHAINLYVYQNLPYDTQSDFVPVALVEASPNVVVVTPSLPINSIQELVDYAKARPGQVNYASAGVGSNSHLSAEMLNAMAKISMVHIPYKGAPQANQDVMTGAVQVHIPSLPAALELIRAGRLKAIAVTSLMRAPELPNVPTVAESIPGYESLAWNGVLAPRGTPPAVVDRLSAEFGEVLKMPDVVQAMTKAGLRPSFKGSKEFDVFIKSEMARWERAVKDAGVKPGTL
jgi:tripartite-type tricarboxylate transporter receptor subunit TctC